MYYVKLNGDGSIQKYPYRVNELKKENPNVSFPDPLTEDILAAYQVFPVDNVDQSHNSLTEKIAAADPVLVNGRWRQQWQVLPLSQEERNQKSRELADYFLFWDGLLVSSVYQTIRAQAITTPAVLVACTEFVAAIGDAKNGRPNENAIQACINNLMAAATFTADEISELNQLLWIGNLDSIYVIS
jgi:predicted nucleic acid-binding protein